MASAVVAAATNGSHQAVAPMAKRFGTASGAVGGRYDASTAQAVSGFPTAANDTGRQGGRAAPRRRDSSSPRRHRTAPWTVAGGGDEEQDGHDECRHLVVQSAAGELPDLDIFERHRRDQGAQVIRTDAGCLGPVPHRILLDGGRHHRT